MAKEKKAVVQEEVKEEKVTSKENSKKKVVKEEKFEDNKKKKSIGRIIFDIVFWVCISCLFIVWVVDFVNTKNDNEPKFCLKTISHNYDDGTTKECVGLGYKVYTYDRTSIKIKKQFTPFFVKMEE